MNYKKSLELMQKAKKIGIFTHANVDGDALGSAFALYYYLTDLGKDVDVIADTTIPNQLKFLNLESLIKQKSNKFYDLVIATDCNTVDMMGINKLSFMSNINTIQFDHHPLNPDFAGVNNVDTATSSASEIVANFFLENNIKVSDRIAELLITGIITDSGGFKFSCTTTSTMGVVYKILNQTNIKISDLMSSIFETETLDSFEMQKYAINHTEFLFDNKACIIKIDNSFFSTTGIDPNACKFLTRIGTEIGGVNLVALISEVQPNVNKVSFRSRNGYSASNCAKVFGGGGHLVASGCKIFGSFDDAVNRIIKAMGDELKCRE